MNRALLFFALLFPSVAVFSYFHFASSPEATRLWYSASKALQFSLPLLGVLALGQKRLWRWEWNREEWRSGLFTGIGIFALLLSLYAALSGLPFLSLTAEAIREKLASFGAETPLRYGALALFISLAHSFLEEYYWRGYVFAELKTWLGSRPAYGLSALAFTGHHIVVIHAYAPQDKAWFLVPIFSGFVFVAGLLWAWVYEKNRSLTGAWLSHFCADAAILLIGAHLVFG